MKKLRLNFGIREIIAILPTVTDNYNKNCLLVNKQ